MSLADADDKENGAEVVELADAEERDYKEMELRFPTCWLFVCYFLFKVADRWHANWI
ncbi:hypothetical protein Tcan_07473 [Toxocara canis]|uniref:Uncharacterized protein n=1 Tax=Toxocara canis TaxID=6265 RepID=A0A0B2VUJ1_TOXCA|nr:hypothetical protein Tcan_07473 [Toxocara canis]